MLGRVIRTAVLLAAAGYLTARESGMTHPGNDRQYDPNNAPADPGSFLKDKKVIWLGSSLSSGPRTQSTPLSAYMEAMYGTKTAADLSVYGSPLTDIVQNSGIARLRRLASENTEADLLICELDESCLKDRGEVSRDQDRFSLDTKTGFGAMQYIISFTREMFRCPVFFWTSFRDPSGTFAEKAAVICASGNADFRTQEALLPKPSETDSIYYFNSRELTKAGTRDLLAPALYREIRR